MNETDMKNRGFERRIDGSPCPSNCMDCQWIGGPDAEAMYGRCNCCCKKCAVYKECDECISPHRWSECTQYFGKSKNDHLIPEIFRLDSIKDGPDWKRRHIDE